MDVHASAAAGVYGLSVDVDGDRLPHAPKWLSADRDKSSGVQWQQTASCCSLAGNRCDFRQRQWPTSRPRQTDKLHINFDLSSGDLRKINAGAVSAPFTIGQQVIAVPLGISLDTQGCCTATSFDRDRLTIAVENEHLDTALCQTTVSN